jgi:hypothetical protein
LALHINACQCNFGSTTSNFGSHAISTFNLVRDIVDVIIRFRVTLMVVLVCEKRESDRDRKKLTVWRAGVKGECDRDRKKLTVWRAGVKGECEGRMRSGKIDIEGIRLIAAGQISFSIIPINLKNPPIIIFQIFHTA